MSDLDSTTGNPAFKSSPRIPKDALGNARLARTRETQGPEHSPDLQTMPTWELLQTPPG